MDEANLTTKCVTLGKFIGKCYAADVFRGETIKSTCTLLLKFKDIEHMKCIKDALLNSIYDKVMAGSDTDLKSFIPQNFEIITSDGEIDNDESLVEAASENKENVPAQKHKKEEKKSPLVALVACNNQPSVSVAIPLQTTPIDRFKVN